MFSSVNSDFIIEGDIDFITNYGFLKNTNIYKAIGMTYFAFTSLSTVGLGDLRPVNDFERAFGSMLLLFGVLIFSYIMGIFIEILNSFKSVNASFDDGDNLSKFFGLIK